PRREMCACLSANQQEGRRVLPHFGRIACQRATGISAPLNRTGPDGCPVVEPPLGSRLTESTALASASAVSCGRTRAVVVTGRSLGHPTRARCVPLGTRARITSNGVSKSGGGERSPRAPSPPAARQKPSVITGPCSLRATTPRGEGGAPTPPTRLARPQVASS